MIKQERGGVGCAFVGNVCVVSVETVGAAGLFVGASSDRNKLHMMTLRTEMLQVRIFTTAVDQNTHTVCVLNKSMDK